MQMCCVFLSRAEFSMLERLHLAERKFNFLQNTFYNKKNQTHKSQAELQETFISQLDEYSMHKSNI